MNMPISTSAVQADLSQAPHRPWNGTLARSRFFDGISLLLPAAERFLIETVEAWLLEAGDGVPAALRADLERFIREERAHQGVHLRYNQQLIACCPAAAETARRAEEAVASLRELDLPLRIALAAAFEDLTSLLSREMLEGRALLAEAPSKQGHIWRWHAREELAHSHIVLAVAAQAGARGARRVLAYTLATAWLTGDVLRLWRTLCGFDIAAGASRCRLLGQSLAFVLRCTPSLGRMAVGWLRCVVR